jgi:hypothetical protein
MRFWPGRLRRARNFSIPTFIAGRAGREGPGTKPIPQAPQEQSDGDAKRVTGDSQGRGAAVAAFWAEC